MSNQVQTNDLNRTIKQINSLCGACDTPFRINLTEFASAARLSNTPRRKVFDLISDAMTCNELIEKIGMWCIAEVEGADVQFNRVVENRKSMKAIALSQTPEFTTLAEIEAYNFGTTRGKDDPALQRLEAFIVACQAIGDQDAAFKARGILDEVVARFW